MTFERKKLASALAHILGAGGAAALVAVPAQAQQDIRVEVTGSNIKRVEAEGALPVAVITREEIQKSGVTSTLELMDKLSMNTSLGNFNPALGEGGSVVGFSSASLRGLGSNRTLILVNGKRVAPYALSNTGTSGVDLSQIPLSVVERVEILKDGASAIYGSDAIAGVINVILRRDFKGVEVGGTYLDSQDGGGGNTEAHVVAGWGDLAKDKVNGWIAYEYQKQRSLRASDRDISKTAFLPEVGVNRTSGNSIPANISQPGGFPGTRNPGFPACLPPFSYPTPGFSANQCRFDFTATIDVIPPSEKNNFMFGGTWQFNPNHRLYVEGSYYKANFLQAVSPTPVSGAFTNNPVQLLPGSPFYPTAFINSIGGNPTLPVNLSYRALEFGPRSDRVDAEASRAVAGVQGTFGGAWDYGVDVNYTSNKQVDKYVGGYLSETHFVPLLTNGTLNPFGANSAAAIAAAQSAFITGDASTNKAKNYGADAKISGDIYKLPAGPLSMAVGASWYKEFLELTNADFLNSGDIIGGLGAIPSLPEVNRKVWAAYAEFNIPIVQTLEGNVAVRYDHYDDFGSTTNPKFSLRWQPSRDILVRGSYGKGFIAPSLYALFQPQYRTNTNNSFDDPLRCETTQSVNDCQLQFNSHRGGNPALTPEKSTQYSVGFVWEPSPVPGLSMGLDYFWIEIKNVQTQITADQVFASPASYAFFANTIVPGYGVPYVVRKPGVDPNFPNLPNEIDYVVEPLVNLGKQGVDGVDVDLRYRFPATSWGRIDAHINGTYLINFKQTQPADLSYPNFAGQSGLLYGYTQGAVPRWKHYFTVDWNYGPWGATVAETFQSHYDEQDLTSDDPNGKRQVGSYEVWDLQGRYTGFKNLTLAAGIRNILDRAPPRVANVGTFQVGYDPSYADPRGRMFYGSASYAFK